MADRRFHGWQALAAIVGSLATLVTACVAAAAFLRDDGGSRPNPRIASASWAAPGRATPGASAPVGASAPAEGTDEPLHDKLRLRLEFHIEFDDDPPNNNPTGGDPDLGR